MTFCEVGDNLPLFFMAFWLQSRNERAGNEPTETIDGTPKVGSQRVFYQHVPNETVGKKVPVVHAPRRLTRTFGFGQIDHRTAAFDR